MKLITILLAPESSPLTFGIPKPTFRILNGARNGFGGPSCDASELLICGLDYAVSPTLFGWFPQPEESGRKVADRPGNPRLAEVVTGIWFGASAWPSRRWQEDCLA
ncbi:uncharacterized protein VTP21DRAFT_946 [Calcarisporiella thermophila]|uniref:uncharacterized protein n=1 Tax=Calcarisporiella thermophila TaxID=911321 RepID=UPI0037431FA5